MKPDAPLPKLLRLGIRGLLHLLFLYVFVTESLGTATHVTFKLELFRHKHVQQYFSTLKVPNILFVLKQDPVN
jgi:hypothetical protein